MVSVQVRGRSTPDGELTITVPPELADHDLIVTVTEALPVDEVVESDGWPDGLFERTVGQWQGPPLRREPVDVPEVRDPLV